MIDVKDIPGMEGGGLIVSTDIKGTFSNEGLISATGKMYYPSIWKLNIISTSITPELGTYIFLNREKFSWIDILAFSMAASNKIVDKYNGQPAYMAGKRVLDKVSLLLIAKQILESKGGKDWNAIMAEKAKVEPLIDDTSQPESPFNPESDYYEPDKPVFTYDPDYGLIIYKSGLIVWTKTGNQYVDPKNGEAISYDKAGHLVHFSSGAVLNVETLELTLPDGSKQTVTNTKKWHEKYLLQLIALAILMIAIIKHRRNGT